MQDRGPAAYVAEFIGTLLLVFFVTAAVSIYVPAPSPQAAVQAAPDFAVIGLVHAFVLFALIQTLAVISGAHFNPAVTVALAALRQIRPPDAVIYIVAQLAGAVAGALLTKWLLTEFSNAEAVNYGATSVSDRLDEKIILGMLGEGLGTFFLVWAIIGVAVAPAGLKDWSGFAIGATLGMAVMVIAPLTGAGLNPARVFGPDLVSGEFGGFDDFMLVYVLAPIIGGLLAAVAYSTLFMAEGKKEPGTAEPVG